MKKQIKTRNTNKKVKIQQNRKTKIKKPSIQKWKFLEHKGPFFPPEYQPVSSYVFSYNGKKRKLSPKAEEVAFLYAKMLNSKCAEEKTFQENFFNDWRTTMTRSERMAINDLTKCDFTLMQAHLQNDNKNKHLLNSDEHGFCKLNGEAVEVVGFKIQGPALFVGRGGHPKMGMLKTGVRPEDVTINFSKDSKVPEPPKGHKWKNVIHDPSVRWLAKWYDDVSGGERYMLAKAASLKMTKQSPNPKGFIKTQQVKPIRKYDNQEMFEALQNGQQYFKTSQLRYLNDLDSPSVEVSQSAVALYLVDHFGFRTDDNVLDAPDHLGCCAIRSRDVQLHKEKYGTENVVVFSSSGKVFNEISVDDKVFRNLQLFQAMLSPEDKLFDRVTPSKLDMYLKSISHDFSEKKLKAYNASVIFDLLLILFKQIYVGFNYKNLECYECANLAVAVVLNHRKTPTNRDPELEQKIIKVDHDIRSLVKQFIGIGGIYKRSNFEIMLKGTALFRDLENIHDLGHYDLMVSRSKYLDPRITVAWCLNNGVPIHEQQLSILQCITIQFHNKQNNRQIYLCVFY